MIGRSTSEVDRCLIPRCTHCQMSERPLAGLLVLDFSQFLAGPAPPCGWPIWARA